MEDFYEDETGAVMVVRRPDGMSLEINGVNVAGTSPDNILIQKLQGHLPLLVHGRTESVLHIGFGESVRAESDRPFASRKIQKSN